MPEPSPQSEAKARPDPLAKALVDADFWRAHYAQLEVEHKQLKAVMANGSIELTDANKKIEALNESLITAANDQLKAIDLLRELSNHVAGRTGMLTRSTQFCAVCENSQTCVLGKVTKFIGD